MKNPTLRNIFNLLEYTDTVTPEIRRLEKAFNQTAQNCCTDTKGVDEINGAVSEYVSEMHYIGFVQGFDLARSLLNDRFI